MVKLFGREFDLVLPNDLDSSSDRLQVWDQLSRTELPTTAEEDWRYGRIDDLDLSAYGEANPFVRDEAGVVELSMLWRKRLGGDFDAVVVISNGRIISSETRPDGGIAMSTPSDVPDLDVVEPFALLGRSLTPQQVSIEIEEVNSGRARRVLVVSVGSSERAIVTSSLLVSVAGGCKAEVFELRVSQDGEQLSLPTTALAVAEGAQLRYFSLQDLEESSWELASLQATVKKEGYLRALHLALGSSYGRLRTECNLDGERAEAEVLAGYIGGGSQTHEFRTFQNHSAPSTVSNLLYKGALAGSSHSIYSGMIKVEKGAMGSNAFQTNRNVVLGEDARADSVPNLDIQENDVKCSHASAVGPVDSEQLYYLCSKGIPTDRAEKMIVTGFFRELVSGDLAEPLGATIDHKLLELWQESEV